MKRTNSSSTEKDRVAPLG